MGTSTIFAIIFTLLIASSTSNANTVFNSRKLADSAPNNSSSAQIPANLPVKGEKEVDPTKLINDKKPEIGKEKPENPVDPVKPGPELDNSSTVNDGSSQTHNQKPKDPEVSNNTSKDSTDPSSTAVDDGTLKPEKGRPKDPVANSDPSKGPNSTTVDVGSSKGEKVKPKDPEENSDRPKEPNSTTVDGGSSKGEKEKPKDPEANNDPSKEPNSTTVDGGSSKGEKEKPKDPEANNDPSKEPNSTMVDGGNSKGEKEKPKDPQPQGESNVPPKSDPVGPKNDNVTAESPPPVVKENEEKNVDGTVNSEENTNDSCHGAAKMCRVEQMLLACIRPSQNGNAELFLVVLNEGEKRVKVNLDIQPPLDGSPQAIKISKHQSKKIDISSILGKGAEIVLHTGDGSCKLQLDRPVSVDTILQQVSLYSRRVTPAYGAYFLFIVALLFGGMWACCKLRRRRHQDGVPYQELEMGMPTSGATVVTADSWDQDWDDDDWDEENAVKSPGGRSFGNISANGLTSRSSKRDGWENDWDD